MEHKSTVLIVDDEPMIRDTLELLLYNEGYNLIFAANGQEAIEKAAEYVPDVVLLDVMMPDMDGFEVCRRLRADDFLAEVPIVMLTALDDKESRLTGIEAGADDFTSKPYDKNELRARVRTIVRLNRYRSLLTEKEKFIKAVRESELLYRTLTESMADGALLVQESKVLFANKAFNNILGYEDAEDFVGRKASELFQGESNPFFEKVFDPCTDEGNIEPVFRGTCLTKAGREIWISAISSIITWKTEPAVLVTVRNITEDALREIALQEKSEQIRKEYARLKSTVKERYKFGNIIGKSAAMQKVYENILKAAATDANVIVTGESGTGKELAAKAVHDLSDRTEGPFVPVNCGAIPENLVESEFFGHKKRCFHRCPY